MSSSMLQILLTQIGVVRQSSCYPMNNSSYHTVFKSMTFFAFFSPYKFEATTFTLIELKQRKCFSGLTLKRKPMLRQRIDEAHEWVNEIPSFHIYDTL